MTIGKKLELIELALYGNPDEININSYSISEQKVFKTPRNVLLEEQKQLIRQIEDLGADYDPALITSPVQRDIPIKFGKRR